MTIERETIRKVAALAELAVTDTEVTALAGQLDRIVAFVQLLEKADVPADAPEFISGPPRVVLRDDVVAPEKLRRSPEMLTTGFEKGLYVVPKLAAQENPE